MKIIDLIQGSPSWLAWRRNGLGSTDLAPIMGFCKYRIGKDVFEDKLGLAEPVFENPMMKRGKDYESEAGEWLSSKLVLQGFINPCVEHSSVSFFHSSLDFLDLESGVIAEIKVPSVATYQKLKSVAGWEEYCQRYLYQCQWHMAVTDKDSIFFVVYSPEEKDAMIKIVQRDESLIDEMKKVATEFWQNLQQGLAPEDNLLVLNPSEAKEVVEEYKALKAQEKSIQEELKKLKKKIIDYGDDGDFQLWDLICKRSQGRVSYDFDQMQDDGIELKKYQRFGIGFYQIKISQKGGK